MRRAMIVVGMVAATLSLAVPASAYTDHRTDPAEGESIDVLASVRTVKPTQDGRQLFVRIVHDTYTDGFNYWVRLDTRGDGRADFRVWVHNTEGPIVCEIHQVGRPGIATRCQGREGGLVAGPSRVVLHEHVRAFRPTKEIRWWIFAPKLYFEDDIPDRAPDHGWYP